MHSVSAGFVFSFSSTFSDSRSPAFERGDESDLLAAFIKRTFVIYSEHQPGKRRVRSPAVSTIRELAHCSLSTMRRVGVHLPRAGVDARKDQAATRGHWTDAVLTFSFGATHSMSARLLQFLYRSELPLKITLSRPASAHFLFPSPNACPGHRRPGAGGRHGIRSVRPVCLIPFPSLPRTNGETATPASNESIPHCECVG